jgi:type IV pilus assembly protein PilZ
MHVRVSSRAMSDPVQGTRVHPRAPIELKVAYQRVNAFFADYSRDISKGGMYIKTDNPLPVGTELQFQITLPRRPQALLLEGRVMWINDGGANAKPAIPQHGMGIQFIWHDDGARETFETVVEELMIETLGRPLYEKLLEKGRT